MPIRDATKDEIEALRARLKEKQEQRWLDEGANEAMGMVHHHPPKGQPQRPRIVEERTTPLTAREYVAREYVARVIPAGRAFSWAAVALIVARTFLDNWLFLLVLGFVVFGAVAVS